MSTTAATILRHKGGAIHGIAADAPLHQAAERMHRHGIGALVVHHEGEIVGIIGERQVTALVATDRTCANTLPVSLAMRRDLGWVTAETGVADCMRRMTAERRRYLLVGDPGDLEPLGIVSIGDVVHAQTADLTETIDHLGTYITGVPDLAPDPAPDRTSTPLEEGLARFVAWYRERFPAAVA